MQRSQQSFVDRQSLDTGSSKQPEPQGSGFWSEKMHKEVSPNLHVFPFWEHVKFLNCSRLEFRELSKSVLKTTWRFLQSPVSKRGKKQGSGYFKGEGPSKYLSQDMWRAVLQYCVGSWTRGRQKLPKTEIHPQLSPGLDEGILFLLQLSQEDINIILRLHTFLYTTYNI